jgi:hypothetical protein
MTSAPPDTASTASPSDSPARRAAIAAAAALGFAWLGALFGQDAGHAVARLLRRNTAEVKDMMIWLFVASPFIMAALGIWLALLLTGAGRAARTLALSILPVMTAGTATMMAASYDWPKTTGTPVYDYELRLPAGVALSNPNLLDMTLWDDTAGTGCSVPSCGTLTAGRRSAAHSCSAAATLHRRRRCGCETARSIRIPKAIGACPLCRQPSPARILALAEDRIHCAAARRAVRAAGRLRDPLSVAAVYVAQAKRS